MYMVVYIVPIFFTSQLDGYWSKPRFVELE